LRKPRRIRATYTRPHGVRHMLGAYDVSPRLIRRYIAWRNYNVDDAKLREVVNTANVA
jgi:hypothetical protein